MKPLKLALIITGALAGAVGITALGIAVRNKSKSVGKKSSAVGEGATDRKMIYPITGTITSAYGARINPITKKETQFHNGIDIGAVTGTIIKSPASGVVQAVYYNDKGGNQLIINHDNGYRTGYCHMSKTYVKVGDKIKEGQAVAEVGTTGASTGSHLHLTLTKADGTFLNPALYFMFA